MCNSSVVVRASLVAVAILVVGTSAAAAGTRPLRGSDDCMLAGRPAGARSVCLGSIAPSRVRVALRSRNGSREHGAAFVTLGLHETKFVIRLRRAPHGTRQPAALRSGSCRSPGRIVYPLGNVVDGRREARLDPDARVTGLVLTVRESTAAGAPVVACGLVPHP